MLTILHTGSGTVTILEAYRALLVANFTPVHDVEFHWYSAVSLLHLYSPPADVLFCFIFRKRVVC